MTALSRLGLLVAALMGAAAGVGLLARSGVYADNALVTAGWLGNDAVTVALAVPLLLLASMRIRSGSPRALLLCLGLLAYAAYCYAFYLFGAAFNALFLVYAAVLALSTAGLIVGLASTQARRVAHEVLPDRTARSVGGAVAMISVVLGAFWVGQSVAHLRTGDVPAMVTATGHPTNVTGALDLWLVVMFGLWGGVWLVAGRGWGFVISAVWSVKGAVYMTALSAASWTAWRSGAVDGLVQLALWVPIGLVCTVGAALLLRRAEAVGVRLDPAPPPPSPVARPPAGSASGPAASPARRRGG